MVRLVIVVLLVLPLLAVTISGQADIRGVDFKNFTYSAHCISETPSKVTVMDGEFYEEKQLDGYTDRFAFRVMEVSYGDLTGDRKDEAIILTVCNTGGTGNFSEGFVYAMKNGKPALVARIPGGDRAYGGLRTTRVENGLLVVENNEVGDEGAACCPQFIVTTRYRLGVNRLSKVGTVTRREMYPKQRVSFSRGSSGTTITTSIPAEEGKRFVVGARAGQKLTVSIDTDKASLRLLEGADVKFGISNFVANLTKTGEYTIEIQNDTSSRLTLTVNIKIQ